MSSKHALNEKLAGANSLLFSDNSACLDEKAMLHRNLANFGSSYRTNFCSFFSHKEGNKIDITRYLFKN